MKRILTAGCAAAMALTLGACSSGSGSTSQKFDRTADLVVVGGGGAGMAAALEAKDNGVENVVLIEKGGTVGGTAIVSQGMIGGYDTKIQKDQGIEITYEQMYDNLMSNANYRLDPELTKITVENSGKTIDWLVDRVQVPFLEEVKVGYGPLQMMHVTGDEETKGGYAMLKPFETALEESGVEVLKNTKGVELVLNEDGSIAGVKAEQEDKPLSIGAKAVVIATGGYASNPELTGILDPEMKGTFGIAHPAATGDGLIMASNAGAALTHTDHLMAVLKDYEIMSEHNGNSASANVSRFIAAPNLVLVNTEGKRFVNEKSGGYMTQELNRPVFNEMTKTDSPYVWAISDKATLDGMEVKRGLDMEFITSDTVEGLAEQMGVDAGVLAKTVEDYNRYAAEGNDPEFARGATGSKDEPMAELKAPFTAVAVVPCEIITYGGIARDEKAEVLRADGSVIPGLYVAGEAGANSAYMGFTLSNCFTWGRIAGASAADYIAK